MKFDDKHHSKDKTLPTSTTVFRVKVVRAFLKSGTPLNPLEYFREVFEEAGFSLTSHLRQHHTYVNSSPLYLRRTTAQFQKRSRAKMSQ